MLSNIKQNKYQVISKIKGVIQIRNKTFIRHLRKQKVAMHIWHFSDIYLLHLLHIFNLLFNSRFLNP